MKKPRSADARRRRASQRWLKSVKWVIGLGVLAAVVYGFSQLSGVTYDERALSVIDFSSLTAAQKRTALVAANNARCSCGCGLGLAQCVATDSTCPIRDKNIDRIKSMVRDAQ